MDRTRNNLRHIGFCCKHHQLTASSLTPKERSSHLDCSGQSSVSLSTSSRTLAAQTTQAGTLAKPALLTSIVVVLFGSTTFATFVASAEPGPPEQQRQQQLRDLSPAARAAWDQAASASYGRWCGAATGGYNSCCGGSACAACDENAITDDQVLPSAACLAACPFQDGLDRACAIHDTCLKKPVVKRNRPISSCSSLSNNFCGCDGQLVSNVKVCSRGDDASESLRVRTRRALVLR